MLSIISSFRLSSSMEARVTMQIKPAIKQRTLAAIRCNKSFFIIVLFFFVIILFLSLFVFRHCKDRFFSLLIPNKSINYFEKPSDSDSNNGHLTRIPLYVVRKAVPSPYSVLHSLILSNKFLQFHFKSCPISSSLLPNIRFVVLFLFIREKNSTFAAELRLRAKTSGFLRVYHDI